MADLQHASLQHALCHEPKHITISSTTDAGKVITSSSSTSGVSVYRNLVESEIDDVRDVYSISAILDGEDYYILPAFSGTLEKVSCVLNTGISTTDVVVTTYISGVPVSDGVVTLVASGSTPGAFFTATPTAANTVTAGISIRLDMSTAASPSTARATFTLVVKRS